MGYSTDFIGQFNLNKPLDEETKTFLQKLAGTRRMARKFPNDEHGVDGEFFIDGGGEYGQARDLTIIDYNTPPSTQPSLWCQWVPNKDGTAIIWDGGEKFYGYRAWIEYIVEKYLRQKDTH